MKSVFDQSAAPPSPNRLGASSSNRFADRASPTFTSIDDSLKASIAAQLWVQLPFARLADETGHRGIEHIVRVASASYTQVVDWHLDLKRMAEAICQVASKFVATRLRSSTSKN